VIIYFVKKNKLWNNKRKEESEEKMTNGEKIIAILKPRKDQIRIYDNWVEIEIQKLGINFSCELDWWNIECNEPSNKSIIYKAKESKEIQKDLDELRKLNEPTTKNDLGVNCSLDDFIKYCKRTFGIELTIKKSDNPDTYAKLFGTTKKVR
jgi:signal transduction histidine kinase